MKKIRELLGKNAKNSEDRNMGSIPSISFFIPTYNEEMTIVEKLSNTLSLHYSREKLRILVVDDASTDRTIPLLEESIRHCPECKIQVIKKKERRGKTDTLNMIANMNNETDLVCISDSDITLDEEALIEVARRFDDTTIGAVCGREVVCNEKDNVAIRTEKMYRDLYITLRVAESLIHSTPIFEAGIMAIRSSLLKPMKSSSGADDTILALNVVKAGYRAVEEPKALFFEHVPETFIGRWKEKARRGKHIARIFIENRSLLFNRKYGQFGMLILPVEAYMHVISPFLCVLLILLAPFSFLNIVTLPIWIVLALSMVSSRLRVTVLSFLTSQLALATGLLSLVIGKKDVFY
jgi:cellulose synthase/poly-beta-1,6-N-acetylglucosamine synthase-like glycosyltransferase